MGELLRTGKRGGVEGEWGSDDRRGATSFSAGWNLATMSESL